MAPLLTLLVGLCLLYHPTLFSAFRLMQNDLGDTRLVQFVLEHSFLWIGGQPGHTEFWSPPIFYPAVNTAAYTETLLGAAPAFWLYRVLGFAPDTSLQLWMLTMSSLNFSAFYLWLRRALGFAGLPSLAGAFLFAFAGPRGAQASHPQLLPQFYSVVALYALTRLFQRSQRDALWITVFVGSSVLQLYASFYLGWLLAFGLFLAALVALARPESRRAVFDVFHRNPRAWAVTLAVGISALAPMALHYSAAAAEIGFRRYDEVFPPRIQAWLYQGGGLYFWQEKIKAFGMLSVEQRMGIGWFTLVLSFLGLRRWRAKAWVRVAIGATIGTLILTTELWPGVTAWRGLFHVLPAAKAIRALSRVSLLALIPLALGLAAYFEQSRRKLATTLAMLLLVLLEQLQPAPAFEKEAARSRVREISSKLPTGCKSFFVTALGTLPEYVYQLDAVLASLELGLPTLNGYSGSAPPTWRPLSKNVATQATELAALKPAAERWLLSQGALSSGLCWISVVDPLVKPPPDAGK